MGRFLASNVALELSVQYASVIAFGRVRVLEDPGEKRRALYGLIAKYFPGMRAGHEYRPITDQELARTSVYAMAVESWSGKENWPEQAEQSDSGRPWMTRFQRALKFTMILRTFFENCGIILSVRRPPPWGS